MKAKRFLGFLFVFYFVWPVYQLYADGKIFIWRNKDVDIFQPTQKAVIYKNDIEQKLILQTKYEGPAEEMVWIVPVPSEPKVKKGNPLLFEEFSKRTQKPDISYTRFVGFAGAAGGVMPQALKWRRRIGAYDVALLSHVGDTQVIDWLMSNDFGVSEESIPILKDYLKRKWWMVAAKIHRDALKDITREKLAKGNLHPLEMTFSTDKCVYPLRLTSLTAGPVEVLLYIEGPSHYEPVTLGGSKWEIDVYGGPLRQVPYMRPPTDMQITMKIIEDKVVLTDKPCLTKLRRVFQPEEMTDDIVFRALDYTTLIDSGNPDKIAQAATQYGRRRDAHAIPYLLRIISPEELKKAKSETKYYAKSVPHKLPLISSDDLKANQHIRSSIWAIGEITLENKADPSIEETLLRCAQHEHPVIRMEAYIALTKFGSKKIGSVMLDRLSKTFGPEPASVLNMTSGTFGMIAAELNIIGEWIEQFGTKSLKSKYVDILTMLLHNSSNGGLDGGISWTVQKAAFLQDPRLIKPLYSLRHVYIGDYPKPKEAKMILLAAEAACGSEEAVAELARQFIAEQSYTLKKGIGPRWAGYASIQNGNYYTNRHSLRTRILSAEKPRFCHHTYMVPADTYDQPIRKAISEGKLDDWYVLYLLNLIRKPNKQDKEKLDEIWNKNGSSDGNVGKRIVIVDVLYRWRDINKLLKLYPICKYEEIRSEIVWSLAMLKIPEAAEYVKREVQINWNKDFVSEGVFFTRRDLYGKRPEEPPGTNLSRKAISLYQYFHPRGEQLDNQRLTVLKMLASDYRLNAGLRFFLLDATYGKTDWGRPLLLRAASEVMRKHSHAAEEKIIKVMGYVGSTDFLLQQWSDEAPYTKQRSLIEALLWTQDPNAFPTIRKAFREIWPEICKNSKDISELFKQSGINSLDNSIERYSKNYPDIIEFLNDITRDSSFDLAYRAFIAYQCPSHSTDYEKLKPVIKDLKKQQIPVEVPQKPPVPPPPPPPPPPPLPF
ncbi:MAG: DUF2330 domain-containing protein [Planctomycetota bacterium]|jgi:hypothetical protein